MSGLKFEFIKNKPKNKDCQEIKFSFYLSKWNYYKTYLGDHVFDKYSYDLLKESGNLKKVLNITALSLLKENLGEPEIKEGY